MADTEWIKEYIDLRVQVAVQAATSALVAEFNKLATSHNTLISETLPPVLEDYQTRKAAAETEARQHALAEKDAEIADLQRRLDAAHTNGAVSDIVSTRR